LAFGQVSTPERLRTNYWMLRFPIRLLGAQGPRAKGADRTGVVSRLEVAVDRRHSLVVRVVPRPIRRKRRVVMARLRMLATSNNFHCTGLPDLLWPPVRKPPAGHQFRLCSFCGSAALLCGCRRRRRTARLSGLGSRYKSARPCWARVPKTGRKRAECCKAQKVLPLQRTGFFAEYRGHVRT